MVLDDADFPIPFDFSFSPFVHVGQQTAVTLTGVLGQHNCKSN